MARGRLNDGEAEEIRGQLAAARIAGDHKLEALCKRALSGLDTVAATEAKALCRFIWGHG